MFRVITIFTPTRSVDSICVTDMDDNELSMFNKSQAKAVFPILNESELAGKKQAADDLCKLLNK